MARIKGTRGDDNLIGTDGNDRIIGGRGDDFISGGKGNDRLKGGAGEDTFAFSAGDGHDRILDYTSLDKIQIDVLEDSVSYVETARGTYINYDGGSIFVRSASKDDLNITFADSPVDPVDPNPGEGVNVVLAPTGTQFMTGTDGAVDHFTFRSLDDFEVRDETPDQNDAFNRFVMFEFEDGTDKVDLSGIDANINTAEDDAFAFIGGAEFSGTAGELRVIDDSVVLGDVDGDGTGDFFFAFRDGFYDNSVVLSEEDLIV